ncbi:hypothetical protein LTR09_001974 [Extremus antarcticus]|uniref:Uncharacterized protein n=1 Tax=Extremus antarcticus TaxID=702011 RepID=A0AAJ0GG71_9PEZI|nr:hypothetical protein LTR09_001974 [Extremus antarcticus]
MPVADAEAFLRAPVQNAWSPLTYGQPLKFPDTQPNNPNQAPTVQSAIPVPTSEQIPVQHFRTTPRTKGSRAVQNVRIGHNPAFQRQPPLSAVLTSTTQQTASGFGSQWDNTYNTPGMMLQVPKPAPRSTEDVRNTTIAQVLEFQRQQQRSAGPESVDQQAMDDSGHGYSNQQVEGDSLRTPTSNRATSRQTLTPAAPAASAPQGPSGTITERDSAIIQGRQSSVGNHTGSDPRGRTHEPMSQPTSRRRTATTADDDDSDRSRSPSTQISGRTRSRAPRGPPGRG